MKRKLNNKAFTFVEIIVVTIILGILATIGFSNFIGNISSGRDTKRKADISELSSSLKTQKQKKGSYPIPSNYFKTNSGSIVLAWQGKLDANIGLSEIDEIPSDPKINVPYLYSISKNKQEFEIVLTLENEDGGGEISLLKGDYKSVAKNILPTLLLATGATSDVDISISNNKDLFIFDNQSHNLPYDFEGNEEPTSDGTSFNDLLLEAEQNGFFSQNSSFETCIEIRKAGKSVGNGEYQIRTNTGALTNTGCLSM